MQASERPRFFYSSVACSSPPTFLEMEDLFFRISYVWKERSVSVFRAVAIGSVFDLVAVEG